MTTNDVKSQQKRSVKIFGQDPAVFVAMWENISSWAMVSILGGFLGMLGIQTRFTAERVQVSVLSHEPVLTKDHDSCESSKNCTKCISIARPGGMEQLRLLTLQEDVCTIGYNVRRLCPAPYTPKMTNENLPSDCVVLKNNYFSVNYADCTIRWGLYESAKRFVGWPIVPGFDVAGIVEKVGKDVTDLKVGDSVFGCTLFGAYSSRIVIPAKQLRHLPDDIAAATAAAIPAVSLTALYALKLSGNWPSPTKNKNKAVLIHSCAGGVGSMLTQMAKLLNLGPIVGVVGRSAKVEAAKRLGCDVVIDKSTQNLWQVAETISPDGYASIFDANGVSTLQDSYEHLAPTGRLIVYGFHTNLPTSAMLSPFEWFRMAKKMLNMPKFDPMDLTVDNKSVMGFNLSFFSQEEDVVEELFDKICTWLNSSQLHCPNVVEMNIAEIGEAHTLIQSGKSIGKIVLSTDT